MFSSSTSKRICSRLCGGFISKGTDGLQSLPHASRVIELKMWLNSLPVSKFVSSNCPTESIARCFVLAYVSRQKTGVVYSSSMVNRITDCSVHPLFLIGELQSQWLARLACWQSLMLHPWTRWRQMNSPGTCPSRRHQEPPVASEWEDQRVTSLSTGGSWMNLCLYSGVRKMALWSDLPKAGSEWAL